MSEPYYFIKGDPACDHNVEQYTLTVIPPITQWKCTKCGCDVRQRGELPEPLRMPDVHLSDEERERMTDAIQGLARPL